MIGARRIEEAEAAPARASSITLRLQIDEVLALVFFAGLILVTAAMPGGRLLESLDQSRLAFFAVVGLLLFLTAFLLLGDLRTGPAREARLRDAARAFWPIPLGMLAYETLKHLHANRISAFLGITPKDWLMLRVDEWLFGAAAPLKLQWMVTGWLTELMKFVYTHVYYATPIGMLGALYFFTMRRDAFYELRRAIIICLYGGYVLYLLVPVAGPQFHVYDQFTVPLRAGETFTNWTFDKLRYEYDCFPSLHTAVPWTVALVARPHVRKSIFALLALSASLLTLSTIYLRFHYGIDIIAGLGWAMIVTVIARRTASTGVDVSMPEHRMPQLRVGVLGALFVCTGGVALLFEQVLEKLISTVVGASTPAAAIVLAVYFTGLAIGGAWFGRFGARLKRPLLAYGLLEAFVGVWALVLYFFFTKMQVGSATLIRLAGDAPVLLFTIRFLVSCLWILPPTIAMGASFPAMVAALRSLPLEPRKTMALFYALNLVGAILGTVLGAFVVLPVAGLSGALLFCVLAELMVFLVAARISSGQQHQQSGVVAVRESGAAPRLALDSGARLVLAIGFISGFAFFAFEVVGVHLIGVAVGTSAYAFADMLAAILLGMLIAGLVVSRRARSLSVLPTWTLGGALALSALALALTTMLWDRAPMLFVPAGKIVRTFAQGEAVRFAMSCLLLLPPAACLGLVYPLLFRMPWFDEARREQFSGLLVASNAVGCFLGAMTAAFFLLPHLGSRTSLLVLSATLAAGALAVAARARREREHRPARLLALGAGLTLVLCAVQPSWNWNRLTSGANVYFARGHTLGDSKLLFRHEDAEGGVTTVTENKATKRSRGRPYRTLLTNGKFQGNDNWEMPAQIAFAILPALHLERIDRALVIGLGTGMSARVVADAGARYVDIAELAPGIVEAARTVFGDLNGRVLERPNVHLYLEDGRNYLLRTEHRYDLVEIEISSIWFAGATNLYSRQFYAAAKKRLAPGAVLQQWIQLHHITEAELGAVINTVAHVFEHVSFYVVGGQGIVLASESPLRIRPSMLERLRALPSLQGDLATMREWGEGEIEDLYERLVLDADDVKRLKQSKKYMGNNDQNRFLEYATPRYYLVRKSTLADNVRALLRWAPPEVQQRRFDLVTKKR